MEGSIRADAALLRVRFLFLQFQSSLSSPFSSSLSPHLTPLSLSLSLFLCSSVYSKCQIPALSAAVHFSGEFQICAALRHTPLSPHFSPHFSPQIYPGFAFSSTRVFYFWSCVLGVLVLVLFRLSFFSFG